MSEGKEDSSIPKRYIRLNLTPEQRARKVALGYDKEDTMHWFAEDNGLEQYENLLGFNRQDLEGKIILDLGTSPSNRLAKDIKEAGINATVVGLSPDLVNLIPNELQGEKLRDEWNRIGVAAIAQAMPFRDSSIDEILGAYSVTWKATTYKEQVQAWVSEISRVLKPGGEARLGPNYRSYPTAMGKDFANIKQYADESGLNIEIGEGFILLKKPEEQVESDTELAA